MIRVASGRVLFGLLAFAGLGSVRAQYNPQGMTLAATALSPAANVSPSALTFGPQAIGTTSGSQTVTVTNTGGADLVVVAVTTGGANASEFTVAADGCTGTTVAPGSSCTFDVAFAPTSVGPAPASVAIADDAADSPQSVDLSGDGVAPGPPVVQVQPPNGDFGNQTTGTSAFAAFSIVNTGDSPLSVSGLTVTGATASEFAVVFDGCTGLSVEVGSSCQFDIAFAPGAVGPATATVTISDNAADTPQTVALSGVGVAPPAAIDSAGPLTHIEITPDLNCSINHVGDTDGEWFADTACGTLVVSGGTLFGPANVPAGGSASPRTPWTPVSQTTGGAGTAADPATITTVVAGGSAVQVTQVDSYVFGQESYLTTVSVKNLTGSPNDVILYRAGDCFLANSDTGFGRIDIVGAGSAPTCVGVDPVTGEAGSRIEQLLPLTPGSHFVEDGFSAVWADIGSQQPLPNTCNPCATRTDNGIGLSWSFTSIPDASQTFSHLSTFSPTGQVPIVASKTADAPTTTPGAQDGYVVTFHNGGTSAATLDSITDTLPTGFSYVVGSTSGGVAVDPAASGSTLTWTGPFAVTAGGDLQFHFNVVVASAPGHYTNTVTAASALATVSPATDTAPVDIAVPTGPAASVDPSAIDFGSQVTGTASGVRTVTVTNTGSAQLAVSGVAVGAGPFAVPADGCTGAVVAPGSSCTFGVSFAPSVVGPASASVSIADDATGSPQVVGLSGVGTAPAAPVASISPATIDFGSRLVGTASGPQLVTVTSSGNASLAVSALGVIGVDAGRFTISQDSCAGATLAPGRSCTFAIIFTPVAVGGAVATVSISDNAADSPQLVGLAGTGSAPGAPAAVLNPVSVNFGSNTIGGATGVRLVTLANPGAAPLVVSGVDLTGSGAPEFAVSADRCTGATLAPTQSCTFAVSFTPTAEGEATAAVTISDNAAGSPQVVGLAGVGLSAGTAPPVTPTTPPTTATPVRSSATATATTGPAGTTTRVPSSTTTPPATVPPTTDQPASGSLALRATPPALRLNSPSGVPGGDVVATGGGCASGAPVRFLIEGQVAGSTVADDKGAFRGRIQVPALRVGPHDVVSQCGDLSVRRQFAVVLSTAAASVPSSVVAAVLAFFVLIGLVLLMVRPQTGTSPRELYRDH